MLYSLTDNSPGPEIPGITSGATARVRSDVGCVGTSNGGSGYANRNTTSTATSAAMVV
ncbi:MAG: hypothetical protein WD069_01575 [Planctomycetales bacterium]